MPGLEPCPVTATGGTDRLTGRSTPRLKLDLLSAFFSTLNEDAQKRTGEREKPVKAQRHCMNPHPSQQIKMTDPNSDTGSRSGVMRLRPDSAFFPIPLAAHWRALEFGTDAKEVFHPQA